MMTPENDEEQ
ncbi:EEV glycoprotein (1), partial [Monkeypox virus]